MTPINEYVEIVKILAPALATAAALAVSASVVGVFVLLRREGLVALAVPQVVAVGAAMGLRMGWPSLPPALVAVFLALVLLVWSRKHGADHWLLPAIYIAGLSLSFLIIANTGQHVIELQNLFTGVDVAVTDGQAQISIPILLVTALCCCLLWRRWLLIAQAPTIAETSGLKPARWDISFLALLCLVLLVGTNDLGAVMVVALLFLPGATILPWVKRLPSAMLASIIAAVLFVVGGFLLSVEWSLPFSQSVGAVGFSFLVLSYTLARIVRS